MSKKINITFEGDALRALEDLCRASNCDTKQVLMDALGFYHTALLQHRKGREVGFLNGGSPKGKITLPFDEVE